MILSLIYAVIAGCISGWGASTVMGADNTNIGMNIVFGILGSVVGTFLFSLVGLRPTNTIGTLIVSIAGACLVIFVYNKYIKK